MQVYFNLSQNNKWVCQYFLEVTAEMEAYQRREIEPAEREVEIVFDYQTLGTAGKRPSSGNSS
ncbi:MAG: hypothetical protein ACQEP9_09195 [Bacillota bacterium]